jgi:hypothetical protein
MSHIFTFQLQNSINLQENKNNFLLRKKIAHTTFTFASLLNNERTIMTNLPFTIDALEEMISSGYVKMTKHPERPLYIYNYTAKAQYEYMWNEVTDALSWLDFG